MIGFDDSEIPHTPAECRKMLEAINVNIVDLVDKAKGAAYRRAFKHCHLAMILLDLRTIGRIPKEVAHIPQSSKVAQDDASCFENACTRVPSHAFTLSFNVSRRPS
ncbi:unnamed protein product [Peniophora sp. CBMAI 1063]|nr:unnamed protein product [Peniophora sp. CBMAI 1063]